MTGQIDQMVETRIKMSQRAQETANIKFRDQIIRMSANNKNDVNLKVELQNTEKRLEGRMDELEDKIEQN